MKFATLLWKNLSRRKVRSILTAFGIAVAVGTTIALLGISDGFERSTVEGFSGRGVDIVVVAGGVLDQLSSELDASVADRIRALPGVKMVGPGLVEMVDFSRASSVIAVVVQGWEADSFLFDGLEITAGRRFKPGEKKVALLGTTLADNLKKKVGDTVEIHREDFKVIGIYRSFNHYENGAITVPLDELQRAAARPDSATGFSVVVDHSQGMPKVKALCDQMNELVDDNGKKLGLSALPTEEYASGSMHIRTAHAMAWLTSMIAIVVGSIGMVNTMVMSVTERIREICILRAIGWRKSRVVRMVVGESLMLSVGGALLGTLGAVALIRALTLLPIANGFVQGNIALLVIGKGWLMAIFIALVGGTWPAMRAARLMPCEGLHRE